MKSYWIWHKGEYEIYHFTKLHLLREERGYHRPAFWQLPTPYVAVVFRKKFTGSGYLICQINGDGHISLDGQRYRKNTRVEIPQGDHLVEIHTNNMGGLPAAFVESDICPSDESWESVPFAYNGDRTPVGSPVGRNRHFTRPDQNPEVFPFSYTHKEPVSVRKTEKGLLYDFGTEVFGYVNIAGSKEKMGIYYGESEAEALDIDYCYITDEVEGQMSYRLKQRAFRYVHIVPAVEHLTVSMDHEYLPLEQVGQFRCDDELFNRLFDVSAYTFHLNCREGFFDGIKRDRWIWAADSLLASRVNRYLFADKDIEQRTLIGLVGKKPITQHINAILDYSMIWHIFLYEHYQTYADLTFLRDIFPMAEELMKFCETRINADGFIEGAAEDWTFIDWAEMEKTGAVCGEQMLLIHAYQAMGEMAKAIGKDGSAYENKAEMLKKRVNQFFWKEEKGAYIDSYVTGNDHVSRHANIFAILYEIADEKQTKAIVDCVINNENIPKITTPYFRCYELDALAKLGKRVQVEETLRSYWGGMLELGAKTVWEEYIPSMEGIEHYAMYGGKYEKSLCHAWSTGPIYLFGRYYLGVESTAPGYETFSVKPDLGGLKQICGTAPVNGGTVTVELDENKLSVLATKPGGTLYWQGKAYKLETNKKLTIDN